MSILNCFVKIRLSLSLNKVIKPISVVRTFQSSSVEDIPEVSSASIKRSLKANNITFEDGFTCFIATCPLCKQGKITSKVYINKTTGLFMCPSCKHSGQWQTFESCTSKKNKKAKSMEMELVVQSQDKFNEYLRNIKENTNDLSSLEDNSFTELIQKLKLPMISISNLIGMNVRVDSDTKKLYFPLENVEEEVVGFQIIGPKPSQETILPKENYGGVLTSKAVKNKDTAILVSSISDFLVLINSKVSGSVVCLPNGTKSLPQQILPTLEKYKKLVLWLGNDMHSWDTARQFTKKLGEKRCLCVRPSDKHVLPHLNESQDFKVILNNAQSIWHKSITTFAQLRQDVLSDFQNIDKVQGIKWKRYPTLNKILKGHRRGELTVITGPTGSGKTTFISEYSLDLAMQGVNTLWGSFEIRNARLARTMLQQMAGIPFDENLHLFDKWADEFEQLPIYYMTFHGQQTIKVVMEAVEHATYVHDIQHVIIDNVQFMMGMSEEQKHMDRFWKQDAVIAAFRSFATSRNCHVTLVIHPRKEREDEDLTTSSIFGGAKASQEADNILIIQDKRLTSIKGKKYLQVAKNRYSGDLGVMALDFNKSALSYAVKTKKPEASKENPQDPSQHTTQENLEFKDIQNP